MNLGFEILDYGILFVLFLALNKDKPHKNILYSLGARIFCFIKLSEIYLRNGQKWLYKKFRWIFRHGRPQFFYIKNTAFYCIWSHLSDAVYFLMFWNNQSFENRRWKNFIGHFLLFSEVDLWQFNKTKNPCS